MKIKCPKVLRNAAIIGGISFFSTLFAVGEPSWKVIYSAICGAGLAFLIEMQHAYNIKPSGKRGCKPSFFF